ncbi:MAG: hypothetical protein KDA96_09975, partial [Planctomycetaceae bacterium]|nr:hypothetical protein [Planctomycetaceae bacterium]
GMFDCVDQRHEESGRHYGYLLPARWQTCHNGKGLVVRKVLDAGRPGDNPPGREIRFCRPVV